MTNPPPRNTDRPPGDGADRPDATHQSRRYVYVARSRRAGGLSLGVDLTPDGHCSFSCVYCQASHPPARKADITVDVQRMRDDMLLRLREDTTGELKDIVLAGAGEPTAVPNLGDCLEAIQDLAGTLQLGIPLRIFTNGRHLDRDDVAAAMGRWCERGGEVWVKLDGADDDTLALINGRRFDVASHLRVLWAFAARHEIGLQTMLVTAQGLPSIDRVVNEVLGALEQAKEIGAKIRELHLLTLSRPPADPQAAQVLRPVPQEELERHATRIQDATGVTVIPFPA